MSFEKAPHGSNKSRPVIIKKVKRNLHGHHGGAWKVAFADFATAMMAFFLLLWIMGNTTEQEKEAISGYFTEPGSSLIGEGGANNSIIELGNPKVETPIISQVPTPEPVQLNEEIIEDLAQQQERARLEQLKTNLEQMVSEHALFSRYADQVQIDIVPSGLRIQIFDKKGRPMFDSGSPDLKYYTLSLLQDLAVVIAQVDNKVSITGHTDAVPYGNGDDEYSNWELSADRANSARRALLRGGLRPQQVAKVEGFGDSVPYNKNDPQHPINRRIAIIVLKKQAELQIQQAVEQLKLPVQKIESGY